MKKIIALALAVVMLLGVAVVAAGDGIATTVYPMKLVVNGMEVTPTNSAGEPAEAISYNNATYLPMRYLAELLGLEVLWDANDPNTAILNGVASVPVSSPVTFANPGTYTGTAAGYNADVTLKVTFSATAVTAIEIESSRETAHVGDSAFEIMFADILKGNGTGIDSVSGATFTSAAIKGAVNKAAEEAGCSDLKAFKKNTVKHLPQTAIEDTWDVVVVGGGGAGMAAAAQAAQNGATVLVIEKAAEIGGNTLVAGGSFQTVEKHLVWDPEDPDATEGVCADDGKTYTKVKNNTGVIDTLKIIATWSEEPFDGTVDANHPFVAGDISLNAPRGVHAEYLPILKTLKEQIKAYLAWAEPQIAAGAKENELTLFSTDELHIFQTYYGGLRPNVDNTEWIYGDFDLVTQFIAGGHELKTWLAEQGGLMRWDRQSTLIGCLWQRINSKDGGMVDGVRYSGNWGAYFAVPANTLLDANSKNEIMTRTTAKELIVEDGKVVGVKATKFDGTEVEAKANLGVIITTGGYASNIAMVKENDNYWNDEWIVAGPGGTTSTSREIICGEGITMATAVGADTVGMEWTQMMPLGWIDNGDLAGGGGENVIYIDPNTGLRYVDESAERDVLSRGAFEHSMTQELAKELGLKYVPGIYVEFAAAAQKGTDVAGRTYYWTVEETAEKLHLSADVLRKTVEDYDAAYMAGNLRDMDVPKSTASAIIGQCEKDEDGNWKTDTHKVELLKVRFMAPSTHHTMGGLKVDTDRHVLKADGSVIEGLWAAGEVCGGFMAGNRLGGNAITEVLVSGRIAAKSVTAPAAE